MLRLLLVSLAFAPATLYPTTGRGDVITQARSTGGPVATDWTQSLVFDQFDPARGTLDAVTLAVAGRIDHEFTFAFVGTETITLTAYGDTLRVGDFLTLEAPGQVIAQAQASGGFVPAPVSIPLAGTVLVPDVTSFVGTGTWTVPVAATSFSTFASDAGNGAGTVRTTAAADVTLSYTYTPAAVPEPATWILPGLVVTGLAARGMIRRRAR
jgi:hypothetical protein